MALSTLIIGLGQIGMGYDLALSPEQKVLTHARAFEVHPAFSLVGGADTEAGRRDRFESVYHRPAFSDAITAVEALRPDILVVAVPTEFHTHVVTTALKVHRPRAILCEKPLAYSLTEAQQILDACKEAGCRLYVNYLRRSEPGVQEVRRRLMADEIKLPVKGIVWYSKGLFHNGSHFLDLMQYWLGEVENFQVIHRGRDYGINDIEPDVSIRFTNGLVHFVSAYEEHFSHYTAEFIAQNGRLRYERGGAEILWQSVHRGLSLPDYAFLEEDEETIATDFDRIQWHVADQLASAIQGDETILCDGFAALRTIEHLMAIKDSL